MVTTDSVLNDAAPLVLVVVGAALCLGAVAVLAVIALLQRRDVRHALDVVVRHQDNSSVYFKKAFAESIGHTDLQARVPDDEGGDEQPDLLRSMRREAERDLRAV